MWAAYDNALIRMDSMNNSESISVRNLPEAQPAWEEIRSSYHVRLKEMYVCEEDIEATFLLDSLLADAAYGFFASGIRVLRRDLYNIEGWGCE